MQTIKYGKKPQIKVCQRTWFYSINQWLMLPAIEHAVLKLSNIKSLNGTDYGKASVYFTY